ncbi:SDR family NAD(P)-dependent oxidoreductase [Demequina aurantiaca]|uniref:SDR family NAD(P)-dependent oxidoreductase n=1 Tax=Demequina aurantiaca TaxID=676200 RepID=UPI003D33D092
MDMNLKGKKAFISGSTQGIGFEIAQALIAEGASVTINGRNESRVENAAARLRATAPGSTVSGIAADFADHAQVTGLLAQLEEVDILVNNVGLFDLAQFQDTTNDDWQRYWDVNVMSGVRLSRQVMTGMLTRNWGRIIFIGSESGVNVPADMIHYGATKAALLGMSNGLAKLTRGTEVTVNTILGGPTYSDGVASTISRIAAAQGIATDDLKAAIIGGNQTSLLERFISPREIANLALYLASPLSSATNGAALRADGGVLTGTL